MIGKAEWANTRWVVERTMTEKQWLVGQLAHPMLKCLRDGSTEPSPRKLRLFAVACCRTAWRHLTEAVPPE